MNIYIQSFIKGVENLCQNTIKQGVPEYALLMALERVNKQYLEPQIQAKMQEELEELSKQAKPVGGPVTEDLPEGE